MKNRLIFDTEGLVQCVCGNTAEQAGFYYCTQDGKAVENQDEAVYDVAAYLRCNQCSRIIDMFNQKVVWKITTTGVREPVLTPVHGKKPWCDDTYTIKTGVKQVLNRALI